MCPALLTGPTAVLEACRLWKCWSCWRGTERREKLRAAVRPEVRRSDIVDDVSESGDGLWDSCNALLSCRSTAVLVVFADVEVERQDIFMPEL